MDSMNELSKEVYNMYLQTAANIISYVDDEQQKRVLNNLTDMIKTSCMLDTKLQRSCQILDSFSTQQSDPGEDIEILDCEETLQKFKNEIAGIDTNVSKHKKFLDFKQQVGVFLDAQPKSNTSIGDDELVMTRREMNVIDPITKKRMVDPVRNTICGHVYEKTSIRALLKSNSRTKCPVAGCANKHWISPDNLQTDILTKNYLEKNSD